MIEYIEPLHEKVLIKPISAEMETKYGIKIPEELQERQAKGIVVAVGEGLKERPMIIVVGALVFHVKGAGQKIQDENGNEYYLMTDKDCLAQIKPENHNLNTE